MEKKPRLWKVENGKFIEISLAQLEAEKIALAELDEEKIAQYLTEEEMYWVLRRMMPQSMQKEEEN